MSLQSMDEEETELQVLPQDQEAPILDISTTDSDCSVIELDLDPHKNNNLSFPDEVHAITWTDQISFVCDTTTQLRILAPKRIHWKGVEWSVLMLFSRGSYKPVGLYLGVEEPFKVPQELLVKLRFRFVLLDQDLRPVDSSSESKVEICKKNQGRDDSGYQHLFDLKPLSTFPETYKLNFRVYAEHYYMPPSIPRTYNSKESTGMVGLSNQGATCYLNSLLQILFHINKFRKAVYELPCDNEDAKSSTTLNMQSLFKNLQCAETEVSTKDLTVSFGWKSREAFMQQDVQEMMRILLDKLEENMKGTNQEGFIQSLFCGKVRSYIRCINVTYESKREEDFYDIQLDVKGCKSIAESFKKYVAIETLDGDNQYDADKFGKQDAQKGVIFTKFPPVLTIHLKRFDFDMVALDFRKIHDSFEFSTFLDVDDYVAKDCPQTVPNRYVLHGVLVHSGDNGGGHYYCYIRPSTECNRQFVYGHEISNQSQWYKFNDETVTTASNFEAIENNFGRRCTPGFEQPIPQFYSAYMLTYIRQSDAPSVMADIDVKDIPPALLNRLDYEATQRRILERSIIAAKMFTFIRVANEKALENFVSFTRNVTFLSDEAMTQVRIMNNSTMLGVLMSLADLYDLYPIQFRLWKINKPDVKSSSTVVEDVVDVKEYRVEVVDPQQRFFFQRIDDFTAEELESFGYEYDQLKTLCKLWIDDLRRALLSYPEYACVKGDPCEGCGIGSANTPLKELKGNNVELHDALMARMDTMETQMFALLEKWSRSLDEHSVLVFFRLFDPFNDFPIPTRASSIPAPVSQHVIDDVESTLSRYCETSFGIEQRADVKFVSQFEDSYPFAFKYLGCACVKNSIEMIRCPNIADRLIAETFSGAPKHWNASDYLFYFLEDSSPWLHLVDMVDENNCNTQLNHYVENGGGTFVLALNPSSHTKLGRPINECQTQTVFQNRLSSKRFIVQPLDPRDLKVLHNVIAAGGCCSEAENIDGTVSKKRPISTDVSANDPMEIVASFDVHLSTNLTVSKLVTLVSQRLKVNPAHVALYLAPDNVPDSRALAIQDYPMHLMVTDKRLSDILYNNGYNKRVYPLFRLFYKFMPFPIAAYNESGSLCDLRPEWKTVDVVISDNRLRKLRRAYITEQNAHFRKCGLLFANAWTEMDRPLSSAAADSLPGKRMRIGDNVQCDARPVQNVFEDPVDWNPYNLLDSFTMSVRINTKTMDFPQVMNAIRKALELPSSHSEAGNDSSLMSQLRSYDMKRLWAVCSESLTYTSSAILPPFPLCLCKVVRNIIKEIFPADSSLGALFSDGSPFSEMASYIKDACVFTLQYISTPDLFWMRGSMEISSRIISVYHFTLLGNTVNPCDIAVFQGPFVTYVREDDTYQALLERLVIQTGDESIWQCRIAVVDFSGIPAFIPKTSITTPSTEATDFNESPSLSRTTTIESGSVSIWEMFARKYSLSQQSILPQLGIQRTTSDLARQQSQSHKTLGSGGIKIT